MVSRIFFTGTRRMAAHDTRCIGLIEDTNEDTAKSPLIY